MNKANLLCIMEIFSVVFVSHISRWLAIDNSSEVILVKLCVIVSLILFSYRQARSLNKLAVDSFARYSCKRFPIEIFCLNAWHIALIAWHMLRLHIIGRSTDPVLANLRNVSVLHL